MARRRWQQGSLEQRGNVWRLRYVVDEVGDDGVMRRRQVSKTLGQAVGPGRITKPQAQQKRWEIMGAVNNRAHNPWSGITLAEFVEQRFRPEHLPMVKKSTARGYEDKLKNILPALGTLELRGARKGHVQQLVNGLAGRGIARTTIQNTIRLVHTLFESAQDAGLFDGRNPARGVRIPKSARRPEPVRGYSLDEMRKIIAGLKSPLSEMVALGCATSMGAAELCGLRIRCLNLSDQSREIDGQIVRPDSLIILENRVENEYGDPKTAHRRRILPIPRFLRDDLARLAHGRNPEDPLFVMPQMLKLGRQVPVDAGNVSSRVFKPLGLKLGIKIGWHRVRHTHATYASEMLADGADRAALMGHWSEATTDAHYVDEFERQRRLADRIGEKLIGAEPQEVQ